MHYKKSKKNFNVGKIYVHFDLGATSMKDLSMHNSFIDESTTWLNLSSI